MIEFILSKFFLDVSISIVLCLLFMMCLVDVLILNFLKEESEDFYDWKI